MTTKDLSPFVGSSKRFSFWPADPYDAEHGRGCWRCLRKPWPMRVDDFMPDKISEYMFDGMSECQIRYQNICLMECPNVSECQISEYMLDGMSECQIGYQNISLMECQHVR